MVKATLTPEEKKKCPRYYRSTIPSTVMNVSITVKALFFFFFFFLNLSSSSSSSSSSSFFFFFFFFFWGGGGVTGVGW